MKMRKCIGFVAYTILGGILPHYELGREWKMPKYVRGLCGKLMFDHCGKNVDIGRKAKLSSHISLGDNSGIGDSCYFQGEVVIKNDVMIAPQVSFIATSHNFSDLNVPMNQQGMISKKITIEDNVWIEYRAIILAGVTVGTGSIIGAGSVVTKDVPSNTIVGGIPARVVKQR